MLYVLFAIIIAIIGCASYEVQNPGSNLQSPASNLFWPPPPQTPRIQYIGRISSTTDLGVKKSWFKKVIESIAGEKDVEGMMLRPYGVFADADRIYVTDPGISLLHVFDMKEKRYFEIRKAGEEDIVSPIGVAVDKNGEIYLSDSMLKKVFVFDKEGKYLREIGSSDLFMRPTGIAIDEDRIYVVDTLSHQVLVFAKKDGKLLFRFGKNGAGTGDFNYPTNIFIGRDKLLYVTDSLNFRVQIFDRDGKFLSMFGKLGDGSGDFSKPKGIAVDSDGHIYIADAHFDNVQIFDRDGKLLLGFGNTGRREGEMVLPAGIFIDERDRIYVADSYNNRIQIFQYLKEKDTRVQGVKDSNEKR
jgi:DNA-binding beta-propeller fold protein YncE